MQEGSIWLYSLLAVRCSLFETRNIFPLHFNSQWNYDLFKFTQALCSTWRSFDKCRTGCFLDSDHKWPRKVVLTGSRNVSTEIRKWPVLEFLSQNYQSSHESTANHQLINQITVAVVIAVN